MLARCRPGWLFLSTFGICAQFAGFAAAAAIGGCGDGAVDSTLGRRVVLQTRVELAEDAAVFTTGVGWSVELTRVLLAVGALRYFDGVPPLAARPRPRGTELAARWLGVDVAHAHPGHYQAGNVLGEMIEPSSVDLLAGPAMLAEAEAVSGTYRSAEWAFAAVSSGPYAGELSGHVALIEGRADRAGEASRSFRAVIDFEELAASSNAGSVTGCVFEQVAVETDGSVFVKVRPAPWFNLVDFAELDPAGPDDPATFPRNSQPRLALAQGLAQHSAYTFSYRPE